MSANEGDRQARDASHALDASQASLQRIDELTSQLDRAAEQLRSGELSADAAATVVEDCAALAGEASSELERLARAPQQVPGQDSLL